MEIGQYIKQLRIAKNLTQEELGQIVGVQRAAVQKWESGMTQNLKRTTMQKLAELFEIDPATLVSGNIEFSRTAINALSKDAEKPTTVSDDELSNMDTELINLLCQLDTEQALRVQDFVKGLLAARKE